MRSEGPPRARRYYAALLFILAGVAIGAWHNHNVDRGHSDPLAASVRETVTPAAHATGGVSRWLSGKTSWIFHGYALTDENRGLRRQLEMLQGENAILRESKIDLDRLRQDYAFVHKSPTALLAADVIGKRPDPKFDTLIISRGSRDGVRPNSVVVTRNGLVGRVFEVNPNSSSVLMLTDQNSGVGARVQRASSRATGVCKGDNSPLLALVYLPGEASIKPGDTIVTSGLGGIFPAGILIGTVDAVKTDEGTVARTARVRPHVDFDRLEEVYVQQ